MNEEVIKYLNHDYLNHLDIIYAINHGASIIYFDNHGIIIKFGDVHILSVKEPELAKQLLDNLDDCKMLAIHNDHNQEFIKEKFKFEPTIIAHQYGYLKEYVTIIDNPKINIKEIGMEHYNFIKDNYSGSIDEEYLIKRIKANVFIGAFDNDKIVGCAGIHDEGSIGFVEVIEEYRRKKIASMLETYMINKLLKNNEIVYLQVEIDNIPSMKFHERLGFIQASDIITWYM